MVEDRFSLQWQQLLSHERARKSHGSSSDFDGRNPFEKDYHRIILSASFRRLQDKTQVFPLDQSDFVRTRLTHSLEVSSLAKSLGEQATALLRRRGVANAPDSIQQKEIADLLLCSGLLHDIGNPPFGHYGETTIRDWYRNHLSTMLFRDKPLSYWLTPQMHADLLNFEGNAQAIRLVSKLHYLVDEHGMNLSFGLLNTLMKYPVSSLMIDPDSADTRYHKMGYFYAEEKLFKAISYATGTAQKWRGEDPLVDRKQLAAKKNTLDKTSAAKQLSFAPDAGRIRVCRHPLTYLLEAADDISYRTADLEDASRKGKITYGQLLSYLLDSVRVIRLHDDTLKHTYFELVTELETRLEQARAKRIQNPELYAIQNWTILLQNHMIRSVTETFADRYESIMQGRYLYDLFHENLAGLLLDVLGDIAYDFVFSSQSIVQLEVASDAIIGGLLDKFVPACLHYDTELDQKPVDKRLMSLISDNYRANYEREADGKEEGEKLYLRLLLVNDYICGMTDRFARDLYYKFNGIY